MDLFFQAAPVKAKRRVHFHAFMAEVHMRVHQCAPAEKQGGRGLGRRSDRASRRVDGRRGVLFCFDEFSVARHRRRDDPRAPFRAAFRRRRRGRRDLECRSPTISTRTGSIAPCSCHSSRCIRERLDIVALDARTDFRLEKLIGETVYHVPADFKAHAALTSAFMSLTGVAHGPEARIEVLGRAILVPQAKGHVARFGFADLCVKLSVRATFWRSRKISTPSSSTPFRSFAPIRPMSPKGSFSWSMRFMTSM